LLDVEFDIAVFVHAMLVVLKFFLWNFSEQVPFVL